MDNMIEKLFNMFKEAQEFLKGFVNKLFGDDRVLDEAAELLQDQQNLYNPDGTFTDEYEALLKKMEDKLSSGALDEMLIASASSPEEADAIRSIIGFVDDRDRLMEDYRTTIAEYDGDAKAWMLDRATEGLDEGQKEIRRKKIEDILDAEDDIIE